MSVTINHYLEVAHRL